MQNLKKYPKIISLLILNFLFLTQIATASSLDHTSGQEFNKADQIIIDNELNQHLNQFLNQLKHIGHSLNYLSLLVYHQASKFKNHKQITSYINQTNIIIETFKNDAFVVPDMQTIFRIQSLNYLLCQNIQNALSKNSWDPINLEQINTRHLPNEYSLESMQENYEKNQNLLNQVEAQIEQFGLTFSQVIVRKIADSIQSSHYYLEQNNLNHKLKYALLGSCLGTYLIYHLQKNSKPTKSSFLDKLLDNKLIQKIKNQIGSAPIYDLKQIPKDEDHYYQRIFIHPKYQYGLTNQTELGVCGKLENFISKHLGTESAPTVLIPGIALGYLTHETIEDNKLVTFGLYTSFDPMVRAMAITNHFLQITKGPLFKNFKHRVYQYLKKQYLAARGQSSKNLFHQQPTTTFSDVIGLEYAKSEFEPVIEYIINPEKFERTKLVPNKGYLMIGAPRTGKSFIAKAICGEINERQKLLNRPKTVNFFNLDADTLLRYNLEEVMGYIRQNAPCIVFIDEIDLLCLNRGNGDKQNMLLSYLLTTMSGTIDPLNENDHDSINKQIIFLAATNNPQSLDKALLQSGRFGKIIAFEYPKLAERINFMTYELQKRAIQNISEKFITQACAELEGCSFEDLSLIITGAIQKASSNYTPIAEEHLRQTIEETIKGIMPQINTPSEQELAIISSYQAGKAIAVKLLKTETLISTITTLPISKKIESKKDGKITINPVIEQGGIFTYQNHNLLNLKSEHDLIQECQILLAGHVAQELILGSSCYQYKAEDQQAALKLAMQIALKGDNYQELTSDLQKELLQRAYLIKKDCLEKVKALLQKNSKLLQKINLELTNKKILNKSEIDQILL